VKKIISFLFIFLVSCSTSKIVTEMVQKSDPCQLEIQHPDILKCLQDKIINNTQSDFETDLCNCKKEFVKKYFPVRDEE